MSPTIVAHDQEPGNSEPLALRTLAASLGDGVRFVQGAGGNISIKRQSVLWVKASGKRFKDAAFSSIFVRMDLDMARERALLDEDLHSACLDSPKSTGLRPSIEAAFHAVLPQTVVVHVHSVGAVAAGLEPLAAAARRLAPLGEILAVPYRRPGRPLAAALVDAGAHERASDTEGIILLANHGLIVTAADPVRAIDLVRGVEELLAPGRLPDRVAAPITARGRSQLFGPGTVGATAFEVLTGGVLTPDSAVFLGTRPFGPEGDDRATCVLSADGAVWVPEELSEDAAQVAESLVHAARFVVGAPRYLRTADVAELIGWDAEKWRQEQQR